MAAKMLCGQAGEQYLFQSSLGEGAMGQLHLCQCTNGGQVVIKQVRIDKLSQQEQAEAINEVKVMQELSHLNIVRYIESIQQVRTKQDGCLYIVMEYCRYGDLSGLIASRTRAGKPFSEQEIMFWFVQIALALWQLHNKGILHRDLKSQNIFIADGAIVKLGDFGISRVLNSNTELVKTAIGTPYYLSPEIVLDKPYNRKSDCWALGCVLYELSSLRRAFDGGSLPALVVKILRGRYPPLPGRYGKHLRGLVDALLQQDPQARPSIDAILRMPYVKIYLAKYAQHVIRLTHKPNIPGISPEVLAAAAADGNSQSANAASSSRALAGRAAAAAGGSSTSSPSYSRPVLGDCTGGCVLEGSQAASSPSVQLTAEGPMTDAAPVTANTDTVDRSTCGSVKELGSCGSDREDSSSAMGSSLASNASSNEDLGSSSWAHNSRPTAGESSEPEGSSDQDQCVAIRPGPISSILLEAQQHQQQRRGLLGTEWLQQQQAALDQLQAAIAAMPGRSAGPWAPQRAAAAQADKTPQKRSGCQQQASSAEQQQPMHEQQVVQQLPSPSAAAAAVTPLQGDPAVSKQQPSSKKGPGSSSKPRGGGACNLAARRKAALSPAEAVRQERAAWRQQQAKDAAAEATRRATRAAELAAALQEKAAQQAKQQQDNASAAAAHRQHMKAVQARIPKRQLAELGAAFRHRLAEQLEAAEVSGSACSSANISTQGQRGAGIVDSSNSNHTGEVVVLQESVGGQALLVDVGDADAAGRAGSAASSRPPSGRRSNSSRLSACSSLSCSVGASVSASVAASRSVSRRSTPEREPAGPGRLTPAEKPWKAARHKSRRRTEPELEIFCPYGATLEDNEQQQQLTAELTLACGLLPNGVLTQVQAGSSARNATRRDGPQMQHVLRQIQTALAGPSGSGAASADALDLPPEVVESSSVQGHSNGAPSPRQTRVLLAAACSGGCAAEATPLALRIEALRCKLEDALGQDMMLLAYKCVEAMQQAPTASTDDDTTGGDELGAGAADSSYNVLLEKLRSILGPERFHLVHQIHKLLLLESQAF